MTRRARGEVADRGGCQAPTWCEAPRPGPVIGGARQGGTHNAEILRAGAGAPRGLRHRDHNAEAEPTYGGYLPRLSLALPEGQLLLSSFNSTI